MKGRLKRNQKKRKMNKHHLRPKSRGGSKVQSNLILIDMERHNAWHILWGNRTLDEIIELLIRLREIKKSQSYEVHNQLKLNFSD